MEEYLGSSKYDGKIRRITLIKKVSDQMKMNDGDIVDYYKVGNDIIIRKSQPREIKQIQDLIPKGTSFEDSKAIIEAAFAISKHFVLRGDYEPNGEEMVTIAAEAMNHYPQEYSNERKGEMLDLSVKVAKEIVTKIRVFNISDPDIAKDLR